MALVSSPSAEPSHPPTELARLRVNESLATLDSEELLLTLAETAAIASLRGQEQESVVRHLHERSGGWAAGLTVLIEHAGGNETAPALNGAAPEALFDYFASEIFDRAPAQLRELWLRTAYLPRFTTAMARRLTGSEGATGLLDELYRRRYFIDRRAASEAYYQYHVLFREFLGRQVERAYIQAESQQLALRSARVLEVHGDFEAALDLYRDAGDWEAAVRLILAQAPDLLAQGRARTLDPWIESLPRQLVEDTPWLLYWWGACRVQIIPAAGKAMLEQACARFGQVRDPIGQGMSAAAVLQSYFVTWGQRLVVDPWIEVLENVFAQRPAFPSAGSELHVWSILLMTLAYCKLGHPFAPACAERVRQLSREDVGAAQQLMAAVGLLYHVSATNDVSAARAIVAEFDPLADAPEVTPLLRFAWSRAQWPHLMSMGDNERALRMIRQSLALAYQEGFALAAIMNRSYECWVLLVMGDVEAASDTLETLASALGQERRDGTGIYNFLRSWEALLRERPRAALGNAEKAAGAADWADLASPAIVVSAVYSQALADCGELEQGLAVARQARPWIEGLDLGIYRFTALLFEADVLRRMDRRQEFLETLSAAFVTGRRSNFLGCEVWLPKMMARLCAEALQADIETEYVQHLIRKRSLVPETLGIENWPWPVKIYTLGRFSLVVDDEAIEFARKAPKKPIALTKFIIAAGGRQVPIARVIDTLWPNEEGDAAQKSFDMTLLRLRKLLGHADVLHLQEGCLRLNPSLCWVDAWAFERCASRVESAPVKCRDDGRIARLQAAIGLYRGNFLSSDIEETWTASMRERLRAFYIELVSLRAAHLTETGRLEEAVRCYRQGLAADDLAEEFYQGIMRCCRCLSRPAEGLAAYQRLRQMLSIKLGVAPSPASQAIARELRDS